MTRHFIPSLAVTLLGGGAALQLWGEDPTTPKPPIPYSQNERDHRPPRSERPDQLAQAYRLYEAKCGSCHSLNRASRKANLSKDEWTDIVYRMRDMASSHISDAQAKSILDVVVWEDQHSQAKEK